MIPTVRDRGARPTATGSGVLHVKTPGHPDDAESDQATRRRATAEGATTRRPAVASLPQTFYTLEQAGEICHRAPGTIANLVSKHQLPRRLGWRVTNRKRRRGVLLSPATVAFLQQVTLLAPVYDRRAGGQTAR